MQQSLSLLESLLQPNNIRLPRVAAVKVNARLFIVVYPDTYFGYKKLLRRIPCYLLTLSFLLLDCCNGGLALEKDFDFYF